MALEFRLPDVGEGLAEATIVNWLVGVGDEIALDSPMVEVETDKAVIEIPAPRAGVVLHLGAAAGETLAVDELLVVIGAPGEFWAPSGPSSPSAPPIVGTLPDVASPGSTKVLPAVRKLAVELGVDLAAVAGSGPGGRITEGDVRAASAGPVDRIALSATRRAVADHLSRSWREIPHVTTFGAAGATRMLAARARSGQPLEAHLIARLIPVLRSVPEFNASLAGSDLLLKRHYDIGFAVDTPEGLMVAVIAGAEVLGVEQLGAEVTRLSVAARDRTIRPEELRGATFTVSNIGAVGGGFGTPIIPYGTTAILSVGRADEVPVVSDGEVVAAPMFPLSVSYDHRVIDGALGRRFMAGIIEAFEKG